MFKIIHAIVDDAEAVSMVSSMVCEISSDQTF